jgi:hypothetical protein
MTREEILSKLEKLQALADRGIGGEKENAKVMLQKFKEKHKEILQQPGHPIIDTGITFSFGVHFNGKTNFDDIPNGALSMSEMLQFMFGSNQQKAEIIKEIATRRANAMRSAAKRGQQKK